MSASEIPENIADKIRKLLALKDGTSNPNEAANAAARIQDLLLKYNLDLEDIGDKITKKVIISQYVSGEALEGNNEGKWRKLLIFAIAKYYLCTPLAYTKKGSIEGVYLIGEEINTQLTMYAHEQLVSKIKELGKNSFREYEGTEKRNAFLRAYYVGCVEGIKLKLKAQSESIKVQDPKMGAMVLSKNHAINDYLQERGIVPKPMNGQALSGNGYSANDARVRGMKDGMNLNINAGLNSNGNQSKLLN